METRANFILIGAFTLAAIVGTLGFFIWLASVQIDRQYATYGILFDDVAGLDPSGNVSFNGISVGRVIGLRIYENDPSKVFTTVEIDATTPVRTNTVAQLQSQGVTGVAYISLSGGTPGAPPLTAKDGALPIIPSRRSTVQTLVEDAPDLLAEATQLLRQFQALTGVENQAYVTNILRNLDESSGRLDQALNDFSQITGTVSEATSEISRFTNRLDSIGAAVETTLARTDTALAAAERAFGSADTALGASGAAIERVEGTFDAAQTILRDQIPEILAQITAVVARTDSAIADLQTRTVSTLDGFGQTAELLNLRLVELEKTLLDASIAFVAVTEASDSFDILVDGDSTLLVAEARDVLADFKTTLGRVDGVIETDLAGLVTDIRTAITTATAAVDRVAGDLSGLAGQFTPLADEAQQALMSANGLFERSQTPLRCWTRRWPGPMVRWPRCRARSMRPRMC